MVPFLIIVAVLSLVIFFFLNQPSFGKLPYGKSPQRIRQSPVYRDGSFQNLTETKMKADGVSYFKMITEFFKKHEHTEPGFIMPSVKRNLRSALGKRPVITWFGHSSYLLQIDGNNILVDPVFSERSSPVQYAGTKAFAGTSIYSVKDLPNIDYVILTHDHYDHLDYGSIKQLRNKPLKYFVPLGVGSHLEYWGINADKIIELDLQEVAMINDKVKLTATPARHFSGRGFTRNKSLWCSYVLETAAHKIFIGGDSGYGEHFKQIGDQYGPFDIVILECGQYNAYWPYIHMMPEETAQAAVDLKGKVLFPVHWGKFKLSMHPWNEPAIRVVKEAEKLNLRVTTPMIGEPIILDESYPNKTWWIDNPA